MVQTKRSSEGFTLFEIMIAIAILGGLIALFYPMITRYQKRGAIQTARLLLGNLKNSINMYKTDTGEYPNTLEDLARKPSDPKVASKWVSEYASEKDINPSQGRLDYKKTPGGTHGYELNYSLEETYPDVEPISVWTEK